MKPALRLVDPSRTTRYINLWAGASLWNEHKQRGLNLASQTPQVSEIKDSLNDADQLISELTDLAEHIPGRRGSMARVETHKVAEYLGPAHDAFLKHAIAAANDGKRIYDTGLPVSATKAREAMHMSNRTLFHKINSHHWLARRAQWLGETFDTDPASLYFSPTFRFFFKDMTVKMAITGGIAALGIGAAWLI